MRSIYRIKVTKCTDIVLHDVDEEEAIAYAKKIYRELCGNQGKIYVHELEVHNRRLVDKRLVYSSDLAPRH